MDHTGTTSPPNRRRPVVPNGMLGMILFTVTELMFFLALISAFLIIKAKSTVWPPIDQPRLPVEVTAVNSVFLIISGVLLWVGARRFKNVAEQARVPLLSAVICATLFVCVQGYEWIQLLTEGLTLTSSSLGSFFYTIIGLHAIHAIVAIGLLLLMTRRLSQGTLTVPALLTVEVFWYFVVGVWPILYWQVYLT